MKGKNSGFSDKNNDTERGTGKKKMTPQTKGDKYPLKNRTRYELDDEDDFEDFKFDDDDFYDDDEDGEEE